MKLAFSKEMRHDAIIGVAGVVSLLGIYVIVSEYKHYGKTQENLQMKDVVTNVKTTVSHVVPSAMLSNAAETAKGVAKGAYDKVTNVAFGAYGKVRSLMPF